MVLPAPALDDRRFQDLVDDAKRLIQQRCPTWTDHNVSDPGVTLIEAYAQMVDQLIYRLNRMPDRNYVKFLELMDVQLRPPSAAHGTVTCWLAAAQPQTVRREAGLRRRPGQGRGHARLCRGWLKRDHQLGDSSRGHEPWRSIAMAAYRGNRRRLRPPHGRSSR